MRVYHHLRHYLLCLSLCLSFGALPAAEMQLEIIPLQHRLVDDLLPTLKPLLVEGGTLTGMNNQLVIRSTPINLQEIKRVLEEIDTPQRSVRINVQFSDADSLQSRGHDLDIQYHRSPLDISTSATQERTWREVREWSDQANNQSDRRPHDRDQGNIRYRQWQTESQQNDESIYFVRTIEGYPAWIKTGETVPFVSSSVILHPYGHDVIDSVDYVDISSGFYVEPHLRQNNVTLFINPQREKTQTRSPDQISHHSAQMTVNGRLGEWIDLGGVSDDIHRDHTELLTRNRQTGQRELHIWVMVEEVH